MSAGSERAKKPPRAEADIGLSPIDTLIARLGRARGVPLQSSNTISSLTTPRASPPSSARSRDVETLGQVSYLQQIL